MNETSLNTAIKSKLFVLLTIIPFAFFFKQSLQISLEFKIPNC